MQSITIKQTQEEIWKDFVHEKGAKLSPYHTCADMYKECLVKHPESGEHIKVAYDGEKVTLCTFRYKVSVEEAIRTLTVWLSSEYVY